MRKECFDAIEIPRLDNDGATQALLAFALLLEKMVSAASLKGDLAASGLAESLLGAAVGFLLHGRAL